MEEKRPEKELGATRDRLSERVCNIESWMRQQGQNRDGEGGDDSIAAGAPAMAPFVQCSVPMDVGRARAPDAQELQYQGVKKL